MTFEHGTDGDDPAEAKGEVVTLADGGRILVRPLLPGDRAELVRGYAALSPEARRLRFFNAPEHLSERLVDYLMDVDQRGRAALVAFAIDDDGPPGVGLARYVRDHDDPRCAEAAVTVLDAYQKRGIATALLRRLADLARENDIDTFTASVMWENRELLDGLRALGADIVHGEPGVASVRIAVPPSGTELPRTELHRALRTFADRVGDGIALHFTR